MDLRTKYLGMELKSPLVVSANPLTESVKNLRRMEDAGAGAIVLVSLFEEQIRAEREALHHYLVYGTESFAEAPTYLPEPTQYHVGTEQYLNLIRAAKEALDIPVIASLNGTSLGGWIKFAKRMEEAGADALELNIYWIPTDMDMNGSEVEEHYVDVVRSVRGALSIPVAVKLSPFFSNFANVARRLEKAGANALVLFNRFYQPDIDLETLEVKPNVILSTPHALRLPLTWIGLLYGRVQCDLAATSGVHTGDDVAKLLLAGANVTMMASAILRNGIDHIHKVETELLGWMATHEYESVQQLRGSVSQINAADPSAFERAQYIRSLQEYKPNV
ncbi:MAG: dihydroorotate dehydrogenase-like protein [Anaerolineae bacterium]|nr:dihydroorotate dehydrogenase-like protein [Anaerolineae bacterium]NUQ06506.1 dihydroorotate dehydrogenase-like protein [Anaerolineae bacterium]